MDAINLSLMGVFSAFLWAFSIFCRRNKSGRDLAMDAKISSTLLSLLEPSGSGETACVSLNFFKIFALCALLNFSESSFAFPGLNGV